MNKAFLPADILLPASADMKKWSVIACDQFSSQPEYWSAVENETSGSPSTLNLMLPEAYLGREAPEDSRKRINASMKHYLDSGVFKEEKNCFIYVRRTISDGRVRQGLVGMLDLEEYDYTSDSSSLVRASEETVVSRLPARIELRTEACIELPHTMVLIDDPGFTVIEPLAHESLDTLYDFDLMQGGGHIKGARVDGALAERIMNDLSHLLDADSCKARYGSVINGSPVLCVVGDGNHSLAAAKACWDRKKQLLTETERRTDPARYSLVELVNIHDPSLDFAPIHRVVFGTQPEKLFEELKATLPEKCSGSEITAVFHGRQERIAMPTDDTGALIRMLQDFLDSYTDKNGGKIDYIHGDETLISLVKSSADIGFMLPPLSKSGLFRSVTASGVLPRKSFSMGQARDKRYYLECRKIV